MALSRTIKLTLLGGAAVGLLALLTLNIQESRTIVVKATPIAATVSATVVGQLANPRYTGQNARGGWEVTAATAIQQASTNQTNPQTGSQTGSVSLTQVAARWEPENAPALALQAPLATFIPSTSILELPRGVAATGVTGPYQTLLTAAKAKADLNQSQLRLSGGVSVTLTPR